MIYRAIVESKLRHAFQALNQGQHGPVLDAFAEPLEHVFYGQHALAGTRRDMHQVRAWYRRLKRIFPDLRFEIDSVAVRGMPWDTTALVEWRDSFTLPDGTLGGNQGVHAMRLRWGKVVSLHIHCDTELLTHWLHAMAEQGRVEAAMLPIGDPFPAPRMTIAA